MHSGYLQEKLWSWLRGTTVLHMAVLYDTQHAGWQNKKTSAKQSYIVHWVGGSRTRC